MRYIAASRDMSFLTRIATAPTLAFAQHDALPCPTRPQEHPLALSTDHDSTILRTPAVGKLVHLPPHLPLRHARPAREAPLWAWEAGLRAPYDG